MGTSHFLDINKISGFTSKVLGFHQHGISRYNIEHPPGPAFTKTDQHKYSRDQDSRPDPAYQNRDQ